LCIAKGIGSASTNGGNPVAFQAVFGGNITNWATNTYSLMFTNGFNSVGGSVVSAQGQPMIQFLYPSVGLGGVVAYYSSIYYGNSTGGVGYPHVFDPGFSIYCTNFYNSCILNSYKTNQWLVGYWSDNEINNNIPNNILNVFLALPATNPSYVANASYMATTNWLETYYPAVLLNTNLITPQVQDQFLAYVYWTYAQIVSPVIKSIDTNHLYLGIRIADAENLSAAVLQAYGSNVDIISDNYYGAWTPGGDWATNTGKPFLVSEFYAQGVDSGLPNPPSGGGGAIVRTQTDRGNYYQNYTLGLMQAGNCVSWNWFQELDSSSNNKGILTTNYIPYSALLNSMQAINQRNYLLQDYFDGTLGE